MVILNTLIRLVHGGESIGVCWCMSSMRHHCTLYSTTYCRRDDLVLDQGERIMAATKSASDKKKRKVVSRRKNESNKRNAVPIMKRKNDRKMSNVVPRRKNTGNVYARPTFCPIE
jgi:hypothetical protein